jgi:exodeoxyribonuclease VII small subunit
MGKSISKENDFESSLGRLEKIVSDIEKGEVPLNKAIDLFEEGMNISKQCLDALDKAEIKLKKLVKNVDGSFLVEEMD